MAQVRHPPGPPMDLANMRRQGVHHLIADRLHDFSALLPELSFASRNFH
jgi:hypothetical protein